MMKNNSADGEKFQCLGVYPFFLRIIASLQQKDSYLFLGEHYMGH